MSRTRMAIITVAAMAVSLTLGACSGEGSDSTDAGRNSSQIAVKDGTEAPAVNAVADCDQTEICLYAHDNFKGKFKFNLPTDGCVSDLRPLLIANDAVTSVVNNSSVPVQLFEDVNKAGRYITIGPNKAEPNLHDNEVTVYQGDGTDANAPGKFNDVISSFCKTETT